MCLNHPELVHKHPALLVSPVTMYIIAHAKWLGLIQLAVGEDKAKNISRAVEKVKEASLNGANIVVLPVIAYERQYE